MLCNFSHWINNIQKYYSVSLCVISIIIVSAPTDLRRFNTWNLHKRNQMSLLEISTNPFALREPTSRGGKERPSFTWFFSKSPTSSLTSIHQKFLPMRWVRKNIVSIKKEYVSIQKINIIVVLIFWIVLPIISMIIMNSKSFITPKNVGILFKYKLLDALKIYIINLGYVW